MKSNAVWQLDEKRMNVVIRGFMDLIQTLPDFQSYFLIVQYQLFVASFFNLKRIIIYMYFFIDVWLTYPFVFTSGVIQSDSIMFFQILFH